MGLGTKKKNKKTKQMNTKERGPKNRGRQINEKHGYKLEGGGMKRKRQTGRDDRSLSKIKYLPCKQTQELSPGTEADHGDNCTCNRGVEEAKAGGSLGLPSQPAQLTNLRSQ